MAIGPSLILLISGASIVVLLAVHAWRLWREIVRRQRLQEVELQQARIHCLENLHILAQTLLAENVDLVEGCIRISVLLDRLEPEFDTCNEFGVFRNVQIDTLHLHTHQARAELSPRQRLQEDRDRLHIAALKRNNILAAADRLVARSAQALTHGGETGSNR